MSDLLAIIEDSDTDEELIAEIIRRHPDRVTVLIAGGDLIPTGDDSPRGLALAERLARLLAAIEARTGAVVVGMANSAEQLRGWRFDRVIGGPQPALR